MQESSRSRDETDFLTHDSTPVARFSVERDLDDEERSKQEGLEEFTLWAEERGLLKKSWPSRRPFGRFIYMCVRL